MPIPTRSGSVKVAASTEDRQPTATAGSRPTSRLPTTASKDSQDAVSEAEPSKLNRISRLVQPKTISHSASAANALTNAKPSGIARSASTASRPPPASTAAEPIRQELRIPATSKQPLKVSHGHSRQESASIAKPRSVPFGHNRAASIATSQSAKSTSLEKASVTKPSFNTFQQHYSPRKPTAGAVKDTTDTKPAPTEAASSSVQNDDLSDELFQLQILHRDADASLKSFTASAERHIAALQDAVLSKQARVAQLKADRQRLVSLKGLEDWLASSSKTYLDQEQQVQRLSKTIDDLRSLEKSLTATDGPLTMFMAWHSSALAVIASRKERSDVPDEFQSVTALGPAWTQEMRRAEQRAAALLGVLQAMRPPESTDKGSGIYALVAGHVELAQLLTSEIAMAMKLEKEVADQEKTWLEEEIGAAIEEFADGQQETTQPLWKEF